MLETTAYSITIGESYHTSRHIHINIETLEHIKCRSVPIAASRYLQTIPNEITYMFKIYTKE